MMSWLQTLITVAAVALVVYVSKRQAFFKTLNSGQIAMYVLLVTVLVALPVNLFVPGEKVKKRDKNGKVILHRGMPVYEYPPSNFQLFMSGGSTTNTGKKKSGGNKKANSKTRDTAAQELDKQKQTIEKLKKELEALQEAKSKDDKASELAKALKDMEKLQVEYDTLKDAVDAAKLIKPEKGASTTKTVDGETQTETRKHEFAPFEKGVHIHNGLSFVNADKHHTSGYHFTARNKIAVRLGQDIVFEYMEDTPIGDVRVVCDNKDLVFNSRTEGNQIIVKCPVGTPIGKGNMTITNGNSEHIFVVYVLFNAWDPESQVYIENQSPKSSLGPADEYVLNDYGCAFTGGASNFDTFGWNYGVHDEEILESAMLLLQSDRRGSTTRSKAFNDLIMNTREFKREADEEGAWEFSKSDPVAISRIFTALVGQFVLYGDWSKGGEHNAKPKLKGIHREVACEFDNDCDFLDKGDFGARGDSGGIKCRDYLMDDKLDDAPKDTRDNIVMDPYSEYHEYSLSQRSGRFRHWKMTKMDKKMQCGFRSLDPTVPDHFPQMLNGYYKSCEDDTSCDDVVLPKDRQGQGLYDESPKCIDKAAKVCQFVAQGDGVDPATWLGSAGVLKTFWGLVKKYPDQPEKWFVKYGQCWVLAGTLCSLMRTLGIPARSISNFHSMHAECDKWVDTLDQEDLMGNRRAPDFTSRDCANPGRGFIPFTNAFHHRNGNKYEEGSVWSFHAWVNVWMARPDLATHEIGKYYTDAGWQHIDATVQENSQYGNSYCGPAPGRAVKELGGFAYIGNEEVVSSIGYDLGFLISELHWLKVEGKYDGESFEIGNNMIVTTKPNTVTANNWTMIEHTAWEDNPFADDISSESRLFWDNKKHKNSRFRTKERHRAGTGAAYMDMLRNAAAKSGSEFSSGMLDIPTFRVLNNDVDFEFSERPLSRDSKVVGIYFQGDDGGAIKCPIGTQKLVVTYTYWLSDYTGAGQTDHMLSGSRTYTAMKSKKIQDHYISHGPPLTDGFATEELLDIDLTSLTTNGVYGLTTKLDTFNLQLDIRFDNGDRVKYMQSTTFSKLKFVTKGSETLEENSYEFVSESDEHLVTGNVKVQLENPFSFEKVSGTFTTTSNQGGIPTTTSEQLVSFDSETGLSEVFTLGVQIKNTSLRESPVEITIVFTPSDLALAPVSSSKLLLTAARVSGEGGEEEEEQTDQEAEEEEQEEEDWTADDDRNDLKGRMKKALGDGQRTDEIIEAFGYNLHDEDTYMGAFRLTGVAKDSSKYHTVDKVNSLIKKWGNKNLVKVIELTGDEYDAINAYMIKTRSEWDV